MVLFLCEGNISHKPVALHPHESAEGLDEEARGPEHGAQRHHSPHFVDDLAPGDGQLSAESPLDKRRQPFKIATQDEGPYVTGPKALFRRVGNHADPAFSSLNASSESISPSASLASISLRCLLDGVVSSPTS